MKLGDRVRLKHNSEQLGGTPIGIIVGAGTGHMDHRPPPDGTGWFLEGWLVLFENRKKPINILEPSLILLIDIF